MIDIELFIRGTSQHPEASAPLAPEAKVSVKTAVASRNLPAIPANTESVKTPATVFLGAQPTRTLSPELTRHANPRTARETPTVVQSHGRVTDFQLEVLDTEYTRRSLTYLIGKILEVKEVKEFADGTRYGVELHPGNRIWLPQAVVRISRKPNIRQGGSTKKADAWNDPMSWR
jgi:hypothetical protein